MTQIERIRQICKEKHIKINKMEADLGFGNGYFNPKKATKISAERVYPIAQYLGVSVEYILTGENSADNDELSESLEQLRSSPETRALLEATKGLDEKQIAKITDFIVTLRGENIDRR